MSDFQISRDPYGKLVYTGSDGVAHVGVVPVRAFPIAAPDEGLSVIGPDGHELAWFPRLSALPSPVRALLEAELAVREFTPTITRLRAVSTFSVPSTWSVDTDRGPTEVVLKSEDDIRRLGNGRLLIGTNHGLNLAIPDMAALDRASRKLLERFL
jgi:hypothetical protein